MYTIYRQFDDLYHNQVQPIQKHHWLHFQVDALLILNPALQMIMLFSIWLDMKLPFFFSSRHLQVSNQVSVKIVPDCMDLRFSVQIGTLGSLSNDDGDGNENVRKTIGLN